ncbi:restriction endonuclease subunit S [Patescibacteria group bacterium]|nr:restriction endonuclease subunit S [Patescibacteria group bacterium]
MTDVKVKNKCFSVWNSKLEGRIDPHYYKPEFISFIKSFDDSPFEVRDLFEIAEKITSGATPKSGGSAYTKDYSTGVPFIRSGEISEDEKIDFEDVLFIKKDVHNNKLKSSKLKRGDILIAIVGATIGQVSLYNFDREANINQAIALVRSENINPSYIKAFLLSGVGQKQLERMKRPVARANINLDEIGKIKIILPSIEIQNKVVKIMESAYKAKAEKEKQADEIFSSIDDYVLDELGIKVPKLEDKMCYAVNAGNCEDSRVDSYYYQPKFKIAEQAISKGKYKIEKLSNYIENIHYGASLKNDYVDSGIRLLRILNLKPNKIDLSNVIFLPEDKRKELGNCFVKEGDLLISRSGTVGVVSVIPKEANGFAFGSFMIKFVLNEKINKHYVSIWLNNKLARLFTLREKIGAIQGNITISTIENFQIPTPALNIQNKIVENFNKKYLEVEKLRNEAINIVKEAKSQVEKIILG